MIRTVSLWIRINGKFSQPLYQARKAGLRCVKARGKWHFNNRGGYQLVDERNCVFDGLDFDLSATQVVELAQRRLRAD
jgi:hypothetical protein